MAMIIDEIVDARARRCVRPGQSMEGVHGRVSERLHADDFTAHRMIIWWPYIMMIKEN